MQWPFMPVKKVERSVESVYFIHTYMRVYTNVEGYTYVFISSTSGLTSTCSVCTTVLVPGVYRVCTTVVVVVPVLR
jgi:hypothetical protein